MNHRFALIWMGCTTFGCWQPVEEEDVATICVQQSDALSPLVVFAGGYAIGSCERNVSYICEASVHDETLVVHTTVQYEEHVGWCGGPDVALITGMSPCTELEPLDAGTYSIQYAGHTVDVTLPNPDASCDSVL